MHQISSSDAAEETRNSASINSSPSSISWRFPCCFLHMEAINSGVLACSLDLSSLLLKYRGKRRLRPRNEDISPLAAIDTGLRVILIVKIRQASKMAMDILRSANFPHLMWLEIDIRLKAYKHAESKTLPDRKTNTCLQSHNPIMVARNMMSRPRLMVYISLSVP